MFCNYFRCALCHDMTPMLTCTRTNVDDMIRETEIAEIKKQIESVQSGNLEQTIEKTVDADGEIAKAFEPPEFSFEDKKPDEPPPFDPTTPAVAATPLVEAPVVAKEPEPAARPAA